LTHLFNFVLAGIATLVDGWSFKDSQKIMEQESKFDAGVHGMEAEGRRADVCCIPWLYCDTRNYIVCQERHSQCNMDELRSRLSIFGAKYICEYLGWCSEGGVLTY